MWTLALVLALVAAGVWRPFRRDLGGVPIRIRVALLGMTLVALGLTLWEGRLLAQSAELRRATVTAVAVAGDIPQQLLANSQTAAMIEGTRWGYLAGVVAMVLIALAILTSGAAGGRRPAARGY